MSAQELLVTALDQRYQKFLEERKRCMAEFSEEAVHDLRIALRRLLALIELLRVIAPHPRLQKLKRAIKDQLDGLDELRDTQVMLAEISEMLDSMFEFTPLQKFLLKREKRLLKAVESDVREFKVSSIARRIENTRADLIETAAGPDLIEPVLSAGDDAWLTIAQRVQRVDSAQPASIHRVRIAFKKFRYLLEIIHPLLPDFPEKNFKNMHAYQAAMGEIQDVEVLLRTLADFAARQKTYDPLPMLRFYEQRHTELIKIYIENMNEFVSFWREAPDKPFAWEIIEEEKP
jgi:CHAD domain-containing protein